MSIGKQIFRGSAGPLADAHIHILHELAEFEPENTGRCLNTVHAHIRTYQLYILYTHAAYILYVHSFIYIHYIHTYLTLNIHTYIHTYLSII